jgi:hypothetical protein
MYLWNKDDFWYWNTTPLFSCVLTISESYLYPFALVISLRDYRSDHVIVSQLVLLVYLIAGCVGWFFESVVGRILDSGCRFKMVVGFEFYLPGCTSYRCLQQFILAVLHVVILIGIICREDQDWVSSDHVVHGVAPPMLSSTPLLALLISPLDCFALSHLHAPLPHMHPWESCKTKLWLPPILVLCMWFDDKCWRGIQWCIVVYVWLS